MNPLTQIYQETSSLPLAQQLEVLHFVEFLKQRTPQVIQRDWKNVFEAAQQFSDDFMSEGRNQPDLQNRETF